MRRTILILSAAMLAIVLLAATAAPAFAYHKGWAHEGWGPRDGWACGLNYDLCWGSSTTTITT